jgi:hypothetical protein
MNLLENIYNPCRGYDRTIIRKNSGRLKVYVYSNIKVGNNYFVSISTYKKFRFTEYYFIKFDNEGNIIETCKTAEII